MEGEAPQADSLANKVPVVDQYGNFGTLDHADAQDAFQNGAFRPATPDEITNFQNEQKFGEGTLNSLKAFGAGAARSATFGASDQALTGSGLVDPNTLDELKKRHGFATGAGEATGIVGSLALAPEASPVGLLSKMGQGITKAAGPAAEGLAGLVANPESSPIINKIISKAGAHAAGSAVEGAAYGLGQSVSEDALGDPSLNAEKMLANVGYGGLFGGAVGGLLSGIGGATEAIKSRSLPERAELAAKYGSKAGQDLTHADIPESPSLGQALDISGAPPETKTGLIEGLRDQKPNAPEIADAAQTLGAPLMEGQVSADQQVQRWDSLLTQTPSVVGVKRQQMYALGVQKATDAVQSALGEGSSASLAEVGNDLKNSLSQKFMSESEPITQLYNELKETTSAIPLNERSLKQIAGNIKKLEGVDVSPQARSLAEDFAARLETLTTVDQLKRFKSAINQELPGIPSVMQKRITSQVAEKLSNLEENSILSFAEKEMKTPEAKERILGLIEQRKSANAAYSELRDKMSTFGDVLGKRRIQGPQDFINFIDEMTPEKFAAKLFQKNNSEFLGYLSKNFPEETQLLTQYQKSELVKNAMKSGQFRPNEIFKSINKMSPELRDLLFTPEQLKILSAAKTYMDAIPKDINPSHTSMAEAYRKMLTNPLSSVLENVKDYGVLKGIKRVVGDTSGGFSGGTQVAQLGAIERTIQKTSNAINRSSKAVFDFSEKVTPKLAGYFGASDHEGSTDNAKKAISSLNERANDPEALVQSLQKNTQHLYDVAPKTAGGLHEVAGRATSFLASKVPQLPPQKPLSPKYQPSKSDVAKFHRYYSIVENPLSALTQVKDSTLTPETMEALTTVYPKLYSEMQQQILDHLMNHMNKKDSEIPYRTKLALSQFLGQDLDNSLNPQSIQLTQSMMPHLGQEQAANQAQGEIKSSQEGLSKLNISQRLLTNMQSTSNRNQREG